MCNIMHSVLKLKPITLGVELKWTNKEHNKFATSYKPQGQSQSCTEQSAGTLAGKDQSGGEAGCTSHRHCWRVRCSAGRSWWRWQQLSLGCTTTGHWHTWPRSRPRSSAHCWTGQCSGPPCSCHSPGCTSSHSHKPHLATKESVAKLIMGVE